MRITEGRAFLGGWLLGAFVLFGTCGLVKLARAGKPTHCGCVNKDHCVEPCSACCGPNGYNDCFKNPSPSRGPVVLPLEDCSVITSSCCR